MPATLCVLLLLTGCGGGGAGGSEAPQAAEAEDAADAGKQVGSTSRPTERLTDAQALVAAKQAFAQAERAALAFSTPDLTLGRVDRATAATAALVSLGTTAQTALAVIGSGAVDFNAHSKEMAPSRGDVGVGIASALHCYRVLERSMACQVTLWQSLVRLSPTRLQVTSWGYRVQWWLEGQDLAYAARATRQTQAFQCADAARRQGCSRVASGADEATERIGYSGRATVPTASTPSIGDGATGAWPFGLSGTLPPPVSRETGRPLPDYLSFQASLQPSNQTLDLERLRLSGTMEFVGTEGFTARLRLGQYDAQARFDDRRMTHLLQTAELLLQDPAQPGRRTTIEWKRQGLTWDASRTVAVPTQDSGTVETSVAQDDGLYRRLDRATFSVQREEFGSGSVDPAQEGSGPFEHRFAVTVSDLSDPPGADRYALTTAWRSAPERAAAPSAAQSGRYRWIDLSACGCFDVQVDRTAAGYTLLETRSGYTWAQPFDAEVPVATISREASPAQVGHYDAADGTLRFSDGSTQRFSFLR